MNACLPSAAILYIHAHTYIHIYMHAYTHTYIHTRIHTNTYIQIHKDIRVAKLSKPENEPGAFSVSAVQVPTEVTYMQLYMHVYTNLWYM